MVIYVRHWQRDQLGGVFPFHLVRRDGDGILLWAPAATRGRLFDMPDGRRLSETPLAEWSAARRVPVPSTVNHGTLAWHPVGRDYSVRWFFRADGTFTRWYGNLEAPAALSPDFPAAVSSNLPAGLSSPSSPAGASSSRAASGAAFLDTVDWDLDVVIRPDRTWEWKDEDIFAERLASPESYWVHDERRVRDAGLSVIALAEAGDFPFDGTWCDFRPDPSWPALPSELPPGFDAPPHW